MGSPKTLRGIELGLRMSKGKDLIQTSVKITLGSERGRGMTEA